MQIFPPGIFFQVEILPINLNGFTAKFHLKFTSKNSTWNIYKPLGHPSIDDVALMPQAKFQFNPTNGLGDVV